MSYYEDERPRMRPARERSRSRSRSRRSDYDDDRSAYESRGNNRTTTLIKRADSFSDVDEEITRDFSPPGARSGYYKKTTIRRSGPRLSRTRSYDDLDDRYDESTYYGGRRSRYGNGRRDRDAPRGYSSDYSSRSSSRSRSRSRNRGPQKRERRKSKVEETLESLGLGGLVGGILGKEAKDRSSPRSRRSASRNGRDRTYSEGRSERRRSKSRTREQITQAVKAALLAGAGEAFRARKEPGGFTGEKGKRILTAAFSAGGVDGLINSGKDPEHHKLRDTIGSVIAGLATSRIVNGPPSRSRSRGASSHDHQGRGSGGGLGDLMAGGTLAAAAKKVVDNMRSSSRSRSRSRGRSEYTDDSRSPSRDKSRRRSVSRAAARGLSAIGLDSAAKKVDPSREQDRRRSRRRDSDDYDDRSSYYDDRSDVGQPRSGAVNERARSASQSRSDWQVGQTRGESPHGYSLDFGPHHNGDPDTDSDSDLGSSSGEERERKQGKRKLLLTTGLASVATIHAGHSVYQTYEKHKARKRAVREGKIAPEQAKKTLNRDRMQEAASVGIAALGLKGMYSEWKEMKEHREEFNEELEKQKRHQQKRQARREKYKQHRSGDSRYSNSMPDLHDAPPMMPPPGGWHRPEYESYSNGAMNVYPADAPHYYDDNPYGSTFARSADQLGGGVGGGVGGGGGGLSSASTLPPPPVGNGYGNGYGIGNGNIDDKNNDGHNGYARPS